MYTGGRPRIGDPMKLRFDEGFKAWLRQYAAQRHKGNVNAAMREVAARGREAIGEEAVDQQEQGATVS